MSKKCCSKHISEDEVKIILSERGISRTKIKTKIIQLLSTSKKPFSASEIHQEIGPKSCNISTVFRALKKFNEKEIVREINLGEDFFRYELINPNEDHSHHHHHVRCRGCGDIKFLDKCDISIFEKSLRKMGFTKMEHYLEFTGICSKCS